MDQISQFERNRLIVKLAVKLNLITVYRVDKSIHPYKITTFNPTIRNKNRYLHTSTKITFYFNLLLLYKIKFQNKKFFCRLRLLLTLTVAVSVEIEDRSLNSLNEGDDHMSVHEHLHPIRHLLINTMTSKNIKYFTRKDNNTEKVKLTASKCLFNSSNLRSNSTLSVSSRLRKYLSSSHVGNTVCSCLLL